MYIEASSELLNSIKQFINKGESVLVSGNIEINGMVYREVQFIKKAFGSREKGVKGILFADSNNNIIKDKAIYSDLCRLSYFYEVFFYNEKELGIFDAIMEEGKVNIEKEELQASIKALDYLADEGIENTNKVKEIMQNIPEFRISTNEKLIKIKKAVSDLDKEGIVFNDEVLSKLYQFYEDAMKQNFLGVKSIASGRDYYDSIKTIAEKKKRKLNIRFNVKIYTPMLKLIYELSYFKRIIEAYSIVIDMNTAHYIKFLQEIDNNKINERQKIIR